MATGDWTLYRGKQDASVLLVVRRVPNTERVEVRRLALDSFELPAEDLLASYERQEADSGLTLKLRNLAEANTAETNTPEMGA